MEALHTMFHVGTVDDREGPLDGASLLLALDVRVVKEHLFRRVTDHRARDRARDGRVVSRYMIVYS